MSHQKLEIREVKTKADWDLFIDLPWKIYKNDPHWVPPLKIAVRDMLNKEKHPFYRHAKLLLLIALRGGECVGRIAGIIDENHNKYQSEKTAFFGFFELENDPAVAKVLLEAVKEWAISNGMDNIRGPMNPSTNYECGLLVEGFDDPPAIMMTYNPSYYQELLEKLGFQKSKDLYAYAVTKASKFGERILAHSERLKQKSSITFRCMNMKEFDKEVEWVLNIYNDAWRDNWGFVPVDLEEFRHLAKDLKMIIDPRICLIAEVKGEKAGFGLTVPDANQAMHKVKNGKLLPTGLLKLLWYLKGPGKKTISRCRIITLGVTKKFQEIGLGPMFYTEYYSRLQELGYSFGEASWILEDNKPMNKALQMMGATRSKVYRIYDQGLN